MHNGITLSDWTTDTKIRNSCLNMGLSAYCRVLLRKPISEMSSEEFVHAKNGLPCPDLTTESRDRKSIYPLKSSGANYSFKSWGYGGYGLNDLRFF